jgi:hypothetical protein
MRILLFSVMFSLLAQSAGDPIRTFQNCAYTPTLPTANARPEVEVALTDAKGAPIPDGYQFRANERIRLTVTSARNGYLYLFQDPPDPDSLVFPTAPKDTNQMAKGVPRGIALGFNSTTDITLLIGVAPEPLPNAARMKADAFRQYFGGLRNCLGTMSQETRLTFRK